MKFLISALLLATAFVFASAHAEKVVTHTVIEGESLEAIAGQYDISVDELMVSNGLQTDELMVGTVIKIPAQHARGYFDPLSGVYHVAKGDDLSSIAERFEVSVSDIEQANALKSNVIHPNQTLSIPGADAVVVAEEIEITPVTTGTVVIEGGSVAVGIGFSWGSGTLTYGGEVFPFKMKGLEFAGVGISKVKMTGKAHGLNNVADFAGTYKGLGGGLTVVAGGASFKARNEHGVTLVMTTFQEGIDLSLGGGGLRIEME
jgi:LysM repeat protein